MAINIRASDQAGHGTAWCWSPWKRAMDIVLASAGVVLLWPLMLAISAAIALSDGLPILFMQWRVGRHGQCFQLIKFRTMTVTGSGESCGLTRDGDSRITLVGRRLRKWKIDELPQLFNVLKGEMSLVGPRPDLERYWSRATDYDRQVLSLIPGLTGSASIVFRDEERILAEVPPEFLTSFYLDEVLPQKAKLDREYATRATFATDCAIIRETLFGPLSRSRARRRENAQLPG